MPLNQAILDRTESFHGLYDPAFEHDACGVGMVASIKGARSNAILRKALTCVCSLIHRGAMDADASRACFNQEWACRGETRLRRRLT